MQSLTARRILLGNPNHDNRGRFATGGVAGAALSVLELPVRAEHAITGKLKGLAGKAIDWLSSPAVMRTAINPKTVVIAGKIGGGLRVVGKLGVKAYFAPWIAGRNAVIAVAKAKGLSDLETKRISAICSCYDALGCKSLFLGLEHAGFPHLAGASVFIPTASVAYLAASTVKNPMAVLRAAKTAIISVKRGLKDSFEMSREMDAVGVLADALKRHAGDDWFYALLCTAMEGADNASNVVALAEKALALNPKLNA